MPPVRISGAVMEMDLVYYNRNATERRNVYRFPIARGAEHDAERIRQFFQTNRDVATRGPRFKR